MSENTFRFVMVAIFVLLLLVMIPHRIRAARSADRISRKEEGIIIMIFLRLFGFTMWLGVLVYMIYPPAMSWSSLTLPIWCRWLGASLAMISLPLLYWVMSSIGTNITDTVAIRQEHQLVTHGPYKWVRHPFYSVTALYVCGIGLLISNWFIGTTAILGLFFIIMRLPIEEQKLEQKFGNAYQEYKERSGKFFPKFF